MVPCAAAAYYRGWMSSEPTWALPLQRAGPGLDAAASVDDVARVVLEALMAEAAVTRAGVAVEQAGGRQLLFLPSERLDGQRPQWCEIDGLADVPLVRALLTDRPVLLEDLDELGRAYPHLLKRQRSLGTRALAAVPLSVDGARLGALLLSYAAPQPFGDTHRRGLSVLAERTARAIQAVRAPWPVTDGVEDDVPDAPAGGGHEASTRLAPGPTAPREARRFLRRQLTSWGVGPSAVQPAELCLSEVTTNAVLHAGTSMRVTVSMHGNRCRVTVRDEGHQQVVHRRPVPAPDDVGGRGLLLVEEVSAAWGSEQSAHGTTVWFDVRTGDSDGSRG